MSAIPTDAASPEFELTGDDSGVDAFLQSFLPPDALKKKEPSEGTPESNTEEKPEEKTEEAEESSDESPEKTETEEESSEETEEAEAERKFSEEGTYVKIKVDGKEHEVPVKDLSRLWGQEAALTQKSQQVADERKKADDTLAKNVAATNALLERAKSRFEPYSKVDFLLAAQQLSPEEYTALRNEAMKAHEDVQFLEQHLDGFMKEINTQQQTSLRERATATLKELGGEDPEKSIPGWNEQAYNELSSYAVSKFGVPKDIMHNLVDGWAIRIMHKAMLYDKGKTNNVVTKKVNKTPKKVIKTSTTPEASRSSNATGAEKAMKALARTGTQDAAADAFLARWDDDAK